jgi:hypothetical protein
MRSLGMQALMILFNENLGDWEVKLGISDTRETIYSARTHTSPTFLRFFVLVFFLVNRIVDV